MTTLKRFWCQVRGHKWDNPFPFADDAVMVCQRCDWWYSWQWGIGGRILS